MIEILPSRSGHPNLILNGRPMHSRHNPVTEAERRWGEINKETFGNNQIAVFIGAGLGYIVEIFLRSRKENAVWIEPVREVYQAACERWNHEHEDRLKVITGNLTEDDLIAAFRGYSDTSSVLIPHLAAFQADPVYQKVYEQTEKFLFKKNVNMTTLSKFDKEWTHNFFKNLPGLLKAEPVTALYKEIYRSFADRKAALVCGAGPSLAESLAEIGQIRNEVLLIAVDTAVSILKKAGLDPDVIVSVDPQAVNSQYLEGYSGNARFVIDPLTSYLSLHRIPEGRLYFCWNPFPAAEILFNCFDADPGRLAFGGSVSTNAYDFAVKAGFRTIILAGQDLSFTNGQAHCRGAVLEERLNYKENRLFRREHHNYRQLTALPPVWLPGLTGGRVHSNAKLKIFYDWFQGRIAADSEKGIQVYNLSQKGAAIPYVKPFNKAYFDTLNSELLSEETGTEQDSKNETEKSRKALESLESLHKDAVQLISLLETGLNLLNLQKTSAETQYIPEKLNENDEKIKKVLQRSPALAFSSQEIILRITEGFSGLKKDPDSEADSQELYESLKRSALYLVRRIPRTVQLVRGIH